MDRPLGTLGTSAVVAVLLLGGPPATAAPDDDPGPALAGTPVAGASGSATPPALTVGRYLDHLPARGSLGYRLPRTAAGSTFHVAALFVGAGDSVGEGVRIEVGTTPGDEGCGSGGVFRPTLGEQAPVLFTTVTTWTDVDDHECAVADDLFLTLHAPDDPADAGREVELLVFEEPPLSDYGMGLLPDPAPPAWTPLAPAASPREVPPGTTPTSAPVVRDGSYRLTLRPGRTQVLAVPLDWDQTVQAQLDARLPVGSPGPGEIAIDVVGPMLGTSEVSFTVTRPDDWTVPTTAPGRLRIGAQSQVVSYAHRDSYDAAVSTEALAGIHYVVVRWPGTDQAGPAAAALEVPATVTLRTTGEATDGVPSYTPVEGLLGPQAGSRLVDGTLQAPPVDAPAAAPVDEPEDGPQPWLVAVAGLAGIGVVGGLVRARRRAVVSREGTYPRHRD